MPSGLRARVPGVAQQKTPDDYYSEEEIQEQLLSLTDAQYQRLLSIAKQQASWSKVQPSDLVNEAIARLLEPQGRRWSKKYTLEQLLGGQHGILRSIGSDIRRKEAKRADLEGTFVELVEIQDSDVLDFLEKQDVIAEIMSTLEHDPLARAVISYLAAGRTRNEIQESLSITYDEYQNTRKRIVRHLQQRVRQ